ncbi:MAG: HAD-IA family hydrolase [Asgard group archaeon]|nr:HAD-IA family hydrolase [Asgard group archaeon]
MNYEKNSNKTNCHNNTSNNQIKAVIFDFDGVLSSFYVRIAGPIISAARYLKPDITDQQIADSTLLILSNISSLDKKLNRIDVFKFGFKMAKSLGMSSFQAMKYVFVSIISYIKARKKIVPITGVREVLRELIALKDYKVILVTNTSRKIINIAEGKIPELKSFDLILTRDEIKSVKPDAKGFLDAMKTFGLEANEVICIGDLASDIIAGKRAGIKTIAIYHKSLDYLKAQLVEQNPDFIISDIRQLPNLLRFLRDCIIEDIRSTIDLTEKTIHDYLLEKKLIISR